MLDQPTQVRTGEELPVEALLSYLEKQEFDISGEVSIKQFPAGFSNLTFFVQLGDQAYVLRRPPFGARAKGGHDMFREYRVMRDLAPLFPKVPKVYHYCEDDAVMGAPFYLMERIEGIILRAPTHRSFVRLSEVAYQQVSSAWLDTFVALHTVDYQAAELADFGRPVGYVERQIKGWSKRYEKAKTEDVAEIDFVMQWLNEHIRPESSHTLIHNDYKYDNVVFEEGNWTSIKAVLDWEMATIGDPLMDLGSSLAYWVNADDMEAERAMAMLPTHFAGNPSRGEVVHQYALKSGRNVDDMVFYYVYGLFKLAVVVQQIYYRYAKGYTQDKRFANLNMIAKTLCIKASLAIQKNRIDQLYS